MSPVYALFVRFNAVRMGPVPSDSVQRWKQRPELNPHSIQRRNLQHFPEGGNSVQLIGDLFVTFCPVALKKTKT